MLRKFPSMLYHKSFQFVFGQTFAPASADDAKLFPRKKICFLKNARLKTILWTGKPRAQTPSIAIGFSQILICEQTLTTCVTSAGLKNSGKVGCWIRRVIFFLGESLSSDKIKRLFASFPLASCHQ